MSVLFSFQLQQSTLVQYIYILFLASLKEERVSQSITTYGKIVNGSSL